MQFGRRVEINCLIYLQGGRSFARENMVNDRKREKKKHDGGRTNGKRGNIRNFFKGVTSQKTVIFAFTTVRKPNIIHQINY